VDNFYTQGWTGGRGVTRRTGTVGGLAMGRTPATLRGPVGCLRSMSGPAS